MEAARGADAENQAPVDRDGTARDAQSSVVVLAGGATARLRGHLLDANNFVTKVSIPYLRNPPLFYRPIRAIYFSLWAYSIYRPFNAPPLKVRN